MALWPVELTWSNRGWVSSRTNWSEVVLELDPRIRQEGGSRCLARRRYYRYPIRTGTTLLVAHRYTLLSYQHPRSWWHPASCTITNHNAYNGRQSTVDMIYRFYALCIITKLKRARARGSWWKHGPGKFEFRVRNSIQKHVSTNRTKKEPCHFANN